MSDTTSQAPLREDYERALRSMGTYMDIQVSDLMELARRARHFADQRQAEALTLSRIMSSPVQVVQEQTSMADAAHLMVQERISGLPVVDRAGSLVGIITEADFLRGLGVPAHQPKHSLWQTLEMLFSHLGQLAELEAPRDPVTAYMVRQVVCAKPDQHVEDVIQLMKQHCVKRVLVCDDQRKVLGVVTRSDLVRIFFDRYRQGQG